MKRLIAAFLLMSIPVVILISVLDSKGLGNEVVYKKKSSSPEPKQEDTPIVENLVKPDELITELKSVDYDDYIFGENIEGSAISIQGRTGIVTFYASDKTVLWNKTDIVETQNRVYIACDYLKKQTEKYGWHCDFICNKKDMMYYEQFSDKISDLDSEQQYREVCKWIKADADSEIIKEKYDLDSIIYLVIINAYGTSYSLPHFIEDGQQNYYECAFMYLFDEEQTDKRETPAAFAHEILHLFGAIDLYETYPYGASAELADYIGNNYPNDIMFTTFERGYVSNQNEITNEISRITAYELGLIDNIDETDIFPELIKEEPFCHNRKDDESGFENPDIVSAIDTTGGFEGTEE